MDLFKDIAPFNDWDVRPALERLLKDNEFISAMGRFSFQGLAKRALAWLRPLIRYGLRRELSGVYSIDDLQRVIERYVSRVIRHTTTGLSYTGLEKLDRCTPYLFVSNHRDIAMDPAFVNYGLFHHGFSTARIAIGDNLLTKAYVSDLMRLNKCFIVNRSPNGVRAAFAVYKKLSTYIRYSIVEDKSHVWLAQREGRAKDGYDRTEPAIIKMLAMSKGKGETLATHINRLHMVPVSISYEYDPCDAAKGREICERAQRGGYEKKENEDVESIAMGISGYKGRVHVSFGTKIQGDFETPEQVAREVDRQIVHNYVLHPTNFFAYKALFGQMPFGFTWEAYSPLEAISRQPEAAFLERVSRYPSELHDVVLKMYAQPILRKQALKATARGRASKKRYLPEKRTRSRCTLVW